MRLAIAASILAQALPVVTLRVQENSNFASIDQFRLESKNNENSERLTTGFKNTKLKRPLRKVKPLRNVLKNVNVLKNNAEECDPVDSATADIGILSCGMNQYCAESAESSLGGFCLPSNVYAGHRQLSGDFYPPPTVCDNSHSDYGSYDCDCNNFDVAQAVGDFTCTLDEFQCKRDNLCGPHTVTQTILANGTARADYCYDFVPPYEKGMCYSLDTESACKIFVGNVQCTSCTLTDGVLNPDTGYIGYGCYEFDCTNIPEVGISGNNCAGNYVFDALLEYFQRTPNPTQAPTTTTPMPSDTPSRSQVPSSRPTIVPSSTPSNQPSSIPSIAPTIKPSSTPSRAPTIKPSSSPSQLPSTVPSFNPSQIPSTQPSGAPSQAPSIHTPQPSSMPTFNKYYPGKEEEPWRDISSAGRISSLTVCVMSMIIVAYQLC